jgi:hypothetical protein
MTKQRSMPYETDKVINEIQNTDEAAGDASRRFKNKLLAGIHINIFNKLID